METVLVMTPSMLVCKGCTLVRKVQDAPEHPTLHKTATCDKGPCSAVFRVSRLRNLVWMVEILRLKTYCHCSEQGGFVFVLLTTLHSLLGSQFPEQGLNPHPQQWKCGVLTTGLGGNSLRAVFKPFSASLSFTSITHLHKSLCSSYLGEGLRIQLCVSFP